MAPALAGLVSLLLDETAPLVAAFKEEELVVLEEDEEEGGLVGEGLGAADGDC